MVTCIRIARRMCLLTASITLFAVTPSPIDSHAPVDPAGVTQSTSPLLESVIALEPRMIRMADVVTRARRAPDARLATCTVRADRQIPVRSLGTPPPAGSESVVPIDTPFPIIDFPGVDDTGRYPASPDMAAGPEHVVEVVNDVYSFFDKCGRRWGTAPFSLIAGIIFGDSTSVFSDPRVVYDTFDDRWFMVVAAVDGPNQSSYVMIMASDNSDPGGTWTVVRVALAGEIAQVPDVGVGPNAIYLSYDVSSFFPFLAFLDARVHVIDKSLVTAGTFTGLLNPGDGSKAQSLRAAVMHSWEGTYWLVNSKATGGDFVTLWGITGAPAAPVMTGYNIPVLSYATVPDCIQPNGQLVEMGTTRLGNAVYESGELWTVHSKHVDVGPPSGIGGVNLHAINTATQSLNVSYYTAFLDTAGNYLYAGYPSVDFDTSGRGIVCVLLGGPTVYLSMGYSGFTAAGGFSWGYYPAVYGEANYAHTGSPPWAWGMTTAVARDPADDVTLWMAGAYASSAPTPSWDTRIVATTQELPGLLSVTPSAPVVSTGLEGGPFTPPEAVYVIEHNGVGSAGLAWTLTGFDFTWNTPDRTAGFVTAGQRDTVRLTIHAESLPPGTYADGYTFDDCFSNQTHSRSTVLTVGADGSCPGAVLDLLPTGAPNTLPVSNEERGVYITAMKDIDVCALGMAADLQVPQGVTVRIYEAKGSARGALLASGTHTATQSGDVMHYVPITYTLNACQEYDITFEFGVANNIRWWAEGLVAEPYDVAGAIRVRDGELAGDAANFALLNFSLLGTPTSCDQTTDLTPPGASWSSCTDTTTERGVFVTANQTMNICALSWYASFGGTPADVTAKIYEATGTTRGALIATGSTTDSGPPGMSARTIPISCQLRKGMDYDFVVEFPASWWACIVESDITLPYTVGDAITVLDGEQAGNANSAIITHFAVDWTPGTAGAPFHLAKPDVYPPPLSLTAADLRYGMFVTALAGEELYSLGWRADIPEGAVISARVYEAAGTTRGVLVSEGTILSSGPGTQWHDVPVSASLNAGSDYDFEIDFTQVNMWRYWTDGSGMPYQPYGVIEVVNSEQGGNAANSILIDMRMNACNAVATGITGSEPVRPPGFSMSFHPNPTSARSTLGFSLDTPGPVTITVYDVTGRKVATLLQNETRPAGPGTVYFDSRSVAAGVYFVKMQTPTKSLSRKLTVVH